MRRVRLFMFLGLLLCACSGVRAAEVVVLTKTPVAEFTLPDGAVLKNAFVWRRNSQGIMIVHDDGQFFLNFDAMPPEWKTAYLGEDAQPVTQTSSEEEKSAVNRKPEPGDRYRVCNILAKVPALEKNTREKLLERVLDEELDQGVLVIGLLQAALDGEWDEANRCILYLEEKGYNISDVARNKLFDDCPQCGGDGEITKKCRACGGSGECSECNKSTSMLGKRSDHEKEDKDPDCEACDGTGKCAICDGKGKGNVHCSACRGTGKVVASDYCVVLRDQWVRNMNSLVSGEAPASIMASPSVDFGSILAQLPGINSNAPAYYASSTYDGEMDANLVVACLMHSLIEKDMSVAKRFNEILEVDYPGNEVIDIDDYLKFCDSCDSKGWVKLECPTCDGTGKCEKCEGSGDNMKLSNWKTNCSECKGTGECRRCEGAGKITIRCRDCLGLGRIIDSSRCEIRRELLVDELNAYYRQHQAGPM